MLYRSMLRVGGSMQEVELLDCSSGEDLKAEVLSWADAFIITYSITDMTSLPVAETLLQKLLQQSPTPPPPVLLCGNKVDLDHQRMVAKHSGVALCAAYGARFAEVSAAEDFGPSTSVSIAFEALLKEVRDRREAALPPRRMSPRVLRTLLTRQSCGLRPTQLIVLESSQQLVGQATPLWGRDWDREKCSAMWSDISPFANATTVSQLSTHSSFPNYRTELWILFKKKKI